MANIVQLFEGKIIRQRDVTPAVVQRALLAVGFDAELKDDGAVVIYEPGPRIIVTIATDPANKLFYSTSWRFRPRVSMQKRLALANRINGRNVGATFVDGDKLQCWSTLSFEGGVLPHYIAYTLRDFRALINEAINEEGSNEVR
jgi:hypothetical protein